MTSLERAGIAPLRRAWPVLGLLSVLGLLAYPFPGAWLGLVGLVSLALVRWRHFGRPLPYTPFAVPFGLYVAGAAVGLAVSFFPHIAEVRFFGLLGAIGAFFLALALLTSARTASRLVLGLLVLAAVLAPLMLILSSPNRFYDRLLLPFPDWARSLIDRSSALTQAAWSSDAAGQRYRLTGSGLGTLSAYGLGLGLGPLLAGPGRRRRLLGGLAVAFFGLFVLLSSARGAVAAAGPTFALFAALTYRRLIPLGLLAGAVVVGLRLASAAGPGPGLVPNWATNPTTLRSRIELWQNGLFLARDFPFTGAGLGIPSVDAVYTPYFLPTRIHFFHLHNIFLQSLLEQGLLGLLGLVGLVAVGLGIGGRALARGGDPLVRSTAISAGGAALAIVLTGLTDVDGVTTIGMLLLFGALGLLAAAERLGAPVGVPERPRRAAMAGWPRAARVAGLALVGLLVMLTLSAFALPPAAAPLPAGLSRPPRALVAELYRNLAALEIARVTVGSGRQTSADDHLAAAQSYLEQARQRGPGGPDPDLHRLLAAALAGSEPARARAELAQADASGPNDSHFLFQLGRLYREAGDVEQAVSIWSRVDRGVGAWNVAGPDSQLILWGTELARRGQWRDAVTVNRAAISAAPASPEPYTALALALARQQGDPAALVALQELNERYPDIPWPSAEISDLYRRAGRADEAAPWDERYDAVSSSERWAALRQRASGLAAPARLDWPTRSAPRAPPAGPPETLGNLVQDPDVQMLLVTNTRPRVCTFSFALTFRRGDTVVATAKSVVSDLPPAQRRAAIFIPSTPLPATGDFPFDGQTDVQCDPESAQRADVAARIGLRDPVILPGLGLDLRVENRDAALHVFTVQATFLKVGQLVGAASGRVDGLAAGETRITTLLFDGKFASYDELIFAVDRLIE